MDFLLLMNMLKCKLNPVSCQFVVISINLIGHLSTRNPYVGFKCFVAHVAGVGSFRAVYFQMFSNVSNSFEELATFSTLVMSLIAVSSQMFCQCVLADEGLGADVALVWTVT